VKERIKLAENDGRVLKTEFTLPTVINNITPRKNGDIKRWEIGRVEELDEQAQSPILPSKLLSRSHN